MLETTFALNQAFFSAALGLLYTTDANNFLSSPSALSS
jgi:hypothetical protein